MATHRCAESSLDTEVAGTLAASSVPTLAPDGMLGHTLPAAPKPARERRGDHPGGEGARRIGRHVVFERIGAGGMGEVFAAWDPELDRRIAIKLLRPSAASDPLEARAVVIREAQALAKIADPHVVSVFDVGTEGDQVFIAMEFVEGETLRAYADEHEAAEILAAYLQAGRGLAAAHRCGVVHRDFKPDNVLVGNDGRVRVLDFGIAVLDAGDDEAGRIVGTPAYMSPEQLAGKKADARSDQFSFCVALFEALEGDRPFAGETVPELTRAVLEDEPRVPPTRRRIHDALRRGLARRPEARFESMEALLDALDPSRTTRRRRWIATGVGVALALSAGVGLGIASAGDRGSCDLEASPLREVWNEAQREKLRASFFVGEAGFEAEALGEIERGLDEHAAAWTRSWSDACTHAQGGTQTERIVERRMACLDQRRVRFEALVLGIEEASGAPRGETRTAAIEAAPLAVRDLPSVAACDDLASLTAQVELPAGVEHRKRVSILREDVQRAMAQMQLARYDEALVRLESIRDQAADLDYAPLQSEVSLALGQTLAAAERLPEARAALSDAYFSAYACEHRDVAATAAVELIGLVGKRLDLPEHGLEWAKHARAASSLTHGDPDRTARRRARHAAVLDALGRSEEALAQVDRALASARADGMDAAVEPELLRVKATALGNLGRVDEAVEVSRKTVELQTTLYGESHPIVGRGLASLGGDLYERRRFDEAKPVLERSVQILSDAYGPRSPATAVPLNALAAIAAAEERYDDSRRQYEVLLEIRRETLGPEHEHTVATLSNLGDLYMRQGRGDEAIELLTDAIASIEAKYGPDTPHLVAVTGNLANALDVEGRTEEAMAMINRSCALAREHFGAHHLRLGDCLHNRGSMLRTLGRYDEAAEDMREAIELWSTSFGESDPRLGRSAAALGLILFKAGEFEQSRAAYLRALANMRRQEPVMTSNVYRAVSGLGRIAVATQRWDEAIEYLEEALEIGLPDAGVHGHVQFGLAQALWASNTDRQRALDLAARARAGYASAGEAGEPFVREVDAWTRRRRGRRR